MMNDQENKDYDITWCEENGFGCPVDEKELEKWNKEIEKAEQNPKEYTAFGVTGGILVMIGVFVHQLISKPVVVMMIIKKIFGWE